MAPCAPTQICPCCSTGVRTAVLAPISWWAAGGVPFPYTLRLPAGLIEGLLQAVTVQLVRMGFRSIVILNGHFGLENSIAVRRAALQCMQVTPATVMPVAEYEVLTDLGNRGDHAGIWESRRHLGDFSALGSQGRPGSGTRRRSGLDATPTPRNGPSKSGPTRRVEHRMTFSQNPWPRLLVQPGVGLQEGVEGGLAAHQSDHLLEQLQVVPEVGR